MATEGEADSGAPLLETARLRLRGHRLDDHAALSAIWGDPDVVRYIGGVPSSPHDAWLRLLRYAGLWKLLGYGFWAIEEKASGRMIGDIGYMDVKRGLTPTLDGMPEIGWALASEAQGRGYASEALAAALAWGDAHFGAHRAACIIAAENAPSIRLATRMGFRFAHEAAHRDDVVQVFFRDVG
jgi:RimJ/RimL family protein N-acetyltransferase